MMLYLPHFTILIIALLVSLFCAKYIRAMNIESLELYGEPWISPRLPWVIFFGYIALLAGMRYGMNDTSAYISSYLKAPDTWSEIINQVLSSDIKYAAWTGLEGICKMFLGNDYHLFFLLIAFIESALFVHVLRREAIDYTSACFFFFASGYYYNYFSMMRQWLAVSILFTSIGALKEKNFWKFALICFIGGLFHPSAWLCIPIYFLLQLEPWSNKQLLVTALFTVAMFCINPILSLVGNSALGSTYSYALDTMAGNSGSSIVRFFITLVPVILAYIYRAENENKTYKICVNFAILNAMLNLLATFTSGLYVIRFTTYIGIFNTILYPYLLHYKNNSQTIRVLFYVVFLIYYIYSTTHMQAWGYKSDIFYWLSNY